MQTVKDTAATAKEKMENASVKIDEEAADAKFAFEEKVEKMKAHGDESAKAEAGARRSERREEAGRRAVALEKQNEAEKARATEPHPGPIGDRPTPADFDMTDANPSGPRMPSGDSAGPAIPNYVGPFSSTVA